MSGSLLEMLVLKARASAHHAAQEADSTMNSVVEQLKARNIKVQAAERSTKQYDAQITVFADNKYQLLIQVSDDGTSQTQLWDVMRKQFKEQGSNTKRIGVIVKDIKKFATIIKKEQKAATKFNPPLAPVK